MLLRLQNLPFPGNSTGHFLQLVKAKNDPDYTAQLVNRAKEQGGLLDKLLHKNDGDGPFAKMPDGKYEIRDHSAENPHWQDMAGRLGVQNVGRDPSTDTATRAVKASKDKFLDAKKDVKERNENLQKQLSRFGPALTDEQRSKYIQAFKSDPKNKAAYEREAQAAKELYAAMKEVAQSPTPQGALDLGTKIQKDPELKKVFGEYKNFHKEVLEPAIAGTAAQLVAENPEDPKGAAAKFLEKMKALKGVAEETGKPLLDIKDGVRQIQGAIQHAASGDFDALNELGKEFEGAGAVLKDGKYVDAIKEFAGSSKGGAELFAGATKALVDAGKFAQHADKGLRYAGFASKVAPGLGILASGASAWINAQKAREGNLGNAIALAGDVVGVLGGAVSYVPGAQPLGFVISGVGAVISAGGELLGNAIDNHKMKDEQRKFLEAAGVKGKLQEALVDTDPDELKVLREDLQLSPEQVQKLTEHYPMLVQRPDAWKPEIAKGSSNPEAAVGAFLSMSQKKFNGYGHATRRGQAATELERLAKESSNPVSKKAFEDAARIMRELPIHGQDYWNYCSGSLGVR